MIRCMIFAIIVTVLPAPENYTTGYLSQFSKSPTDGTLYYRQYESKEIDPHIAYDGYIATSDCDRVGQEALLRISYNDYQSDWLFVAVFDCSGHASTTEWMARDNIIAEVDYYTAKEHGFLGMGNVKGEIRWLEAR